MSLRYDLPFLVVFSMIKGKLELTACDVNIVMVFNRYNDFLTWVITLWTDKIFQ